MARNARPRLEDLVYAYSHRIGHFELREICGHTGTLTLCFLEAIQLLRPNTTITEALEQAREAADEYQNLHQ